ncbi:MAG: hypothetical protein JWM27_2835 [Gemmatimonadetes bacterium]|nr:hypothetical protein [Gemmatimonadota bacterium]
MITRTRGALLVASAASVLAGFGWQAGGAPEPAYPAGEKPGVVRLLESGLDSAQRRQLYHMAEGSEVLPYAWFRALESVTTRRPFLEQPERFGLISDPGDPDGLPIGMTAAPTVDTRLLGIRMTGFNCAACHVNEITYRGTALRIDGAPSNFEADTFKADLKASMKHTAEDPVALLEFIWRLRRGDEPGSPQLPVQVRGETGRLVRDVESLSREAEHDADALRLLGWVRKAVERERAHPPEDMLLGLQVAPRSAAGGVQPDIESAPPLPERLTYASAAAEADAIVPDDSVGAGTRMVRNASGELSPAKHVEAFLSDVVLTVRLMRARIASFHRTIPTVTTTVAGWGRVDAFGTARNILFPQDTTPNTAPVSYPFLWGFGAQPWLHYDGNTNSVMQRNIGQALGVGAVYDSTTLISTLDPYALHFLEMTTRAITPPRWPQDVLGRIDPALAAQGQRTFARRCASCHTSPPADTTYGPDAVGTDDRRLVNFALPMQDGRHFTDWAATLLAGVETQMFRIFPVPAESLASFRGPTADWRTTSRWTARPLAGIWATAPFLHNGSVPTLHDLLLPAAQRPVTFQTGPGEFDPQKVGLGVTGQPSRVLDTRRVGNRNTGHSGPRFGTDLTPAERAALLEYLKRL